MDILSIIIIAFVLMELSNVIILYFKPEFKYGNSVNCFNGWHKSKDDEYLHEFVKYLVNWVAGVKLIFIVLSIVIVIFGSFILKLFTAGAFVLSISSFYWRLYPIIKNLDKNGQITPKGYSKQLAITIMGMMLMFVVALIVALVRYF